MNWAESLRIARTADTLGLEALIPVCRWKGFGGPSEFNHRTFETWTWAAGLAQATGDDQWIHTDPVRAAAGPFGTTVAHGYLTLSLAPVLLPQVVISTGFKMGVNYGCNKVRFMSPVPVGANLRLGVKLLAVDDIAGGVQSTYELTFETEGAAKPSCVAEVIFRSYE